MKNNYPIGYALMPIKEQVGWNIGLNELERDYDIVGYIVSKCYQITDNINYKRNGKQEQIYKVVFIFQQDSDGNYVRVEPSYNLVHGKCTNDTEVTQVFKTYQEAVEEAKIQNEKILRKKITLAPYNNNYNEVISTIKNEHDRKLQQYHALEQEFEKKSSDLVVDKKFKEQRVIVVTDGEIKEKDFSLYDLIRLFSTEEFKAFHVNLDEYKQIKELINKKGELPKGLNNRILLESTKNSRIITINDYNSESEIGSFYLQDEGMFYDEKLLVPQKNNDDDNNYNYMKVYTLETYEDIINSYIPYFYSNSSYARCKMSDEILKKKIIKKIQ